MRAKGYGEEAINYFKACVCYLLSAKSKQGMHDRFRKEFECIWPRDFVQYYRGKLLPRSGNPPIYRQAPKNLYQYLLLMLYTTSYKYTSDVRTLLIPTMSSSIELNQRKT